MDEELKKAIEERNKYLEQHPEMKDYQKEIDDILNKTNDDQRMMAIGIMIATKTLELSKELNTLKELLLTEAEKQNETNTM